MITMQPIKNLYSFLWSDYTANNCNTYLIRDGKNILIDPGHFHLFGHVQDALSRLSMSLKDIDVVIITHGHPDHMEAIRVFDLKSSLIAVHAKEMDFIRNVAPHYGNALGLPGFEPQLLLREGELNIGALTFHVIHTPGHSPGSICLYWPENKALFTGDVVFSQGVGRTDLAGGNGGELKESIRKISRLDTGFLLPGHGEVVAGADAVRENFKEIEEFWFAYI